jgi:hypothetical protein
MACLGSGFAEQEVVCADARALWREGSSRESSEEVGEVALRCDLVSVWDGWGGGLDQRR